MIPYANYHFLKSAQLFFKGIIFSIDEKDHEKVFRFKGIDENDVMFSVVNISDNDVVIILNEQRETINSGEFIAFVNYNNKSVRKYNEHVGTDYIERLKFWLIDWDEELPSACNFDNLPKKLYVLLKQEEKENE